MKTLVVEDSRLARQGLIRMLRNYGNLEVIGDAADVSSALLLIEQHKPELLFLDIHMPEQSGFDLLEQLDYEPKIIFTTAFSEYAINSFDYNTIDYLLKPISKERLEQAITKLSTTINISTTVNVSTDTNEGFGQDAKPPEQILELDSRIFVKDKDRCHLIEIGQITCFESCKNYVQVYFNGQKAFVKKSLNQVEERLPARVFFRANRQFIVNLHAITVIQDSISDGYEVSLNDGRIIEVSRRNAIRMKDLLSL